VLPTKVGRWLRPEGPERIDRGTFVGGLNFQPVYDYSYDGTMRALEQSYQRLGMNEIDIVLIHDVDVWTHGSAEAYERRFREAIDGPTEHLTNCATAASGSANRGAVTSFAIGHREVNGRRVRCFLANRNEIRSVIAGSIRSP
jgi:hypothetical protein